MTWAQERATTYSTVSEILQEDRSLYSTQYALGFRSLNFLPEIEQDFRNHFLENSPGQMRRVLPLALLLTLLFTLTDYVRLPTVLFEEIFPLRGIQLLALALLAVPVYKGSYRLLEMSVIAALLVYGVSTPIMLGKINLFGEFSPISAQLLILMFCYFLAGLRFVPALLAGLGISLAYPSSQLLFDQPLPNLPFNCYMILAFNVLGLSGAYFLEYTSRDNYLGRQLLSELALFDGLTGLLNRRAFSLDLEKICRQAKREKAELAVAMIDVDNFKDFNDYFGHVQGDQCLRKIASALQDSLKRPLDKAGRYGGEEFVMVWYGCNAIAARALGEDARKAVEALAIPHGPHASQRMVTVSVGVAVSDAADMLDGGNLIRAADRALYHAKESGRNRVVLANERNFNPKPI